MKWQYILELSWRNLMNRKIRSILTISGVIIGVCSITFLISIGYGFEKMTTSKISNKDTLKIFDVNLENSDLTEIDEKKVADIRNTANVEVFEPGITIAGKADNGKVSTNVIVDGYANKFLEMSDIRLLRGQKYDDLDTNNAIVTTGVLKSFDIQMDNFSETEINIQLIANHSLSPTHTDGDTVDMKKVKIVGVVDDDQSAYVYMPFEVVKSVVSATSYNVGKIMVADNSDNKISETRSKIETIGFGTNYIGDTIKQITSFFAVFRYIVGGFGFVAMLVAVLGMFNTLTVSLLERTREVGVLKSNGAVMRDIWRIFLSEALAISFVGGVLGILFGVALGQAVNIIFNILAQRNGSEPVDFFYTPLYFVAFTIILTVVIGFITGYYPAKRATKINALDALKYE